MGYIDSMEEFQEFARGVIYPREHKLFGELPEGAFVRLVPEDIDVGGGRMKLHEIDRLRDFPNARILVVSGLNQEGFEYLIRTYGQQFRVLQFFKNKLVEDWSLLSTLPDLEYVYYFFNQRIDRFWDMSENKKLKGLSILDFSRLKSLRGIERAENLEYFRLGNAVWDKAVVDSYRYFENTNVRYLSFWGKKILDTDPFYLPSMKKLERFDGIMYGCTKEQFAWVKANAANSLNIGPCVMTDTDPKTKEIQEWAVFPWKGKRSYLLKGKEQRFAGELAEFNALVEQYRGVPYEAIFGETTP